MTAPHKVEWAIRDDHTLPPHIKYLLLTLASRLPDCHPPLALIAKDLGYSRPTAKRWVAKAIELGVLKAEPRHHPDGGRASHRYTFPRHERQQA